MLLEKVFEVEKCPGRTVRAELAARLRVSPRQIQVWFQNKRQRTRAGAKPTVAESIAHETRDTEMAAHEAVAALMSMRHASKSTRGRVGGSGAAAWTRIA